MTDQGGEERDFVTEAHARGLLTFFDVATLLDLRTTEVLDLMRDGHIESVRVKNKPCASLPALDAYRRRRLTQRPGIS
ncbi:MAG: hypothetical protein AB1679_17340 [Actinomycetota bacterium]|jgi:hypothetical protein